MIIDIHTNQNGIDWFCYDDPLTMEIVVGCRGENEMRIGRWDWVRAEDSFRWRNNRNWTPEEAITWAIKHTQKESEYVDYEEVKPNIILLGLGNPAVETNQTK